MGLTGEIVECIGFIMVVTDVRDIDGINRTIDFARLSTGISPHPRCHYSVEPLVNKAREKARLYLRTTKGKYA